MRATFDEYDKLSTKGIEKAVEKELHGDMEKGCLAIGNTDLTFLFMWMNYL